LSSKVRVVYDTERVDTRDDGVPRGMRVIAGDPLMPISNDPCGVRDTSSPSSSPTKTTSTPTNSPNPSSTLTSSGRGNRPGIPPNRGPKVTTTVVSSGTRPSRPSSPQKNNWSSRGNSPPSGGGRWGWRGWQG
jgi:hypothetical protein